MPPLEGVSISFRACQLVDLAALQEALRCVSEEGRGSVPPTGIAHLDLSCNDLQHLGRPADANGAISSSLSPTSLAASPLATDSLVRYDRFDSLARFDRLLSLDFSRNAVAEVGILPSTLIHLNGCYNQLEDLSFLAPLTSLLELDLSCNGRATEPDTRTRPSHAAVE